MYVHFGPRSECSINYTYGLLAVKRTKQQQLQYLRNWQILLYDARTIPGIFTQLHEN